MAYSIEWAGETFGGVKTTGDEETERVVSRKTDGSNGFHSTFLFHETPSNLPCIREKLPRLLCIPEILFPSCGGVQIGLARSNGLEAFSEPPLTHGGPTPNVNPARFPGCDFGPPREILPLVTFSFSKLSTVQSIKESPQTGQYFIPSHKIIPLALMEAVNPVFSPACEQGGALIGVGCE